MLNKKNKLKRFIACCLTAVIFGTLSHVQNVSADTKTNDDLLISQSSDTTENSVELIDADSKGVLDKIDGTHQIENTKVTEKTQARMDQLAKVLLQFYGVTSVQYAMMDHGEYVLNGQAGYSNVEAKKAPTEDTLYGVASVSKMYVTAAVMILEQQGKLDIDTPVYKYVPEFTMQDERYKDITVRMLLNHTSGLLGSTFHNSMLLGDRDLELKGSLLEALSKQRLSSNPGELPVYCNDGFSLAEIVVEKVSGMSYTEFLHTYITGPIGANNTYTPADSFNLAKMCNIYNSGKRMRPEILTSIGAGGIISTAKDLCKFGQLFTEQNVGILSKDSINCMQSKQYLDKLWFEDDDNLFSFGLGWDSVQLNPLKQAGIKALSKGGDLSYYHSAFIVLPEQDITIAINTVGGASTYNQTAAISVLFTYMHENGMVVEDYTDTIPIFTEMPKIDAMPASYKEYTGKYYSSVGVFNIEVNDTVLNISVDGQETVIPCRYYSDGWFINEQNGMYMNLYTDKNHKKYIYLKSPVNMLGIGVMNQGLVFLQEMEDYEVSDEVLEAWKKREGKNYILVNESYKSIAYNLHTNQSIFTVPEISENNYLLIMKLIDEKTAISDYQVPMNYGRDLVDLQIETSNGIEFLNLGSYKLISFDYLNEFSTKVKKVKIKSSDFAETYLLGEETEGKKIQITLPDKANFVVINENGFVESNYYLDHKKTVTLPKGGVIQFFGAKDAEIKVNFK